MSFNTLENMHICSREETVGLGSKLYLFKVKFGFFLSFFLVCFRNGELGFYCGESKIKMARHLTDKHADESDVIQTLSHPTNSAKSQIAKRSIAFTFYHNKVKEEDYGVCADCLGLSAESKPMVKQTSEIIQKSLPMFGIVG